MRIVFSDESGTGDKRDPLTIVTAVVLEADIQWEPFDHDFRMAVLQVPEEQRRFILENRTREVKGNRLFRALRRRPDCYAATLLMEIATLPGRHRTLVFYGAVNRAAIAQKRDERRDELFLNPKTDVDLDAAFRECLERVERSPRATLDRQENRTSRVVAPASANVRRVTHSETRFAKRVEVTHVGDERVQPVFKLLR